MFKFPDSPIKISFMSHISEEIKKLHDRKSLITLTEYKELRINSYEDKYIEPRLDNEAFLYKMSIYFKQVRPLTEYELPGTYEDWMQHDGIKQLYLRFLSVTHRIAIMKDCLQYLKDTHSTNLGKVIIMLEETEWRNLI